MPTVVGKAEKTQLSMCLPAATPVPPIPRRWLTISFVDLGSACKLIHPLENFRPFPAFIFTSILYALSSVI